jgi:N-acetylneuraminate synthase
MAKRVRRSGGIDFKSPFVVAEIGCNHMGNFEIAKQMISVAKHFCKADAVKFQKRTPRELLSKEEYDAPHPEPHQSYGDSYGAHREILEFSPAQHRMLKKYCESQRIAYSTSVWDLTSAKQIVALKPRMIKIPSACNLRFDMLEYICRDFKGEIHISLGMTTRKEERKIVDFMKKMGRAKDTVLYACTSGYPVPFEDVCLLEITRLRKAYGSVVKEIAFSGHHNGIAIDLVAYALGAPIIERHFTLDRTWKGTDHAASLEPDGMRRLIRGLHAAQVSLSYKRTEILPIETIQRNKLKRI